MTYDEIRQKIRDISTTSARLKQRKVAIANDRKTITVKRKEALKSYQDSVSSAKSEAFNAYQKGLVEPYQEKLSALEQQISEKEIYFNEKIEGITEESVGAKYSEERESFSEVQESLESIKSSLEKALGPRFTNELCAQLDDKKLTINKDDMDYFIDYLHGLHRQIEHLNAIDITIKFESLLEKISQSRLAQNGLNKVIIAGLLMILAVIFTYKILPFYLIIILAVFIWSAYKSYKMYEALIAYKGIEDNIKEIEESINKRIEEEIKEQRNSIQAARDSEIRKMDRIKDGLNQKIQEVIQDSVNSFTFDNNAEQTAYEASIGNLDEEEQRLDLEDKEIGEQLTQLLNQRKECEAMLRKIANDIPKNMLNPQNVGTEYMLDPKFLIDVENNKPVFFEFQQDSTLFLYDDLEGAVKFLKLFMLQLRMKLNPFAFNIILADAKYMGSQFRAFTDGMDEGGTDTLFQILQTDENVVEKIKEMSDVLIKRLKIIHPNIIEYNNMMLESESVPESYQYFFVIDPSDQLIGNSTYYQLNRTGGKLGIYSISFMQQDYFYNLGDTARDLVDTINYYYKIENEHISKLSNSAIKDKYIKPKSNSAPAAFPQ